MPRVSTTSKVSRWDQHGREHVVRVQRAGVQRTIRCDTCGWRRGAQVEGVGDAVGDRGVEGDRCRPLVGVLDELE
ncbi:hypothetical protein ACWC19_12830, partial [Streptomyces sp. 900105245]